MKFNWISLVGLLLLSQPSFAIDLAGGFIRLMPPTSKTTAGYGKLTSKVDTCLVSFSSDVANKVELHKHSEENGMMKMRHVERFLVTEQTPLNMESGGYHLMLIGLKRPLKDGERIVIQAQDEEGQRYPLTLTVGRDY
ncbi:MAG: hypothetical protein CMF25_08035 [Kangiellaceae bacterium]|nr:hypothetical protein [Kangiellaceae bacterium]|tara:strand:+ start:9486 stop:9899 length:414 start_codon:yes stop_codon:yes gene_type:complete